MRTLLAALFLTFGLAAHAEEITGAQAYNRLCKSCHGADGRGSEAKAKVLKVDTEVLNLGRADRARASRADLKAILLEGKDKMPAYQTKLKPEEVDPVLDYAIALAKAIRDAT